MSTELLRRGLCLQDNDRRGVDNPRLTHARLPPRRRLGRIETAKRGSAPGHRGTRRATGRRCAPRALAKEPSARTISPPPPNGVRGQNPLVPCARLPGFPPVSRSACGHGLGFAPVTAESPRKLVFAGYNRGHGKRIRKEDLMAQALAVLVEE